MTRIVLVPGCLALLPDYASLTDPVDALRSACDAALRWLGGRVTVVADEQGRRIAQALLGSREVVDDVDVPSFLVVGNGSARRSEQAPGYLDERSLAFDTGLGRALTAPDAQELRELDDVLAKELWAETATFPQLAELIDGAQTVSVDYDAAPFGVQYWVIRWRHVA